MAKYRVRELEGVGAPTGVWIRLAGALKPQFLKPGVEFTVPDETKPGLNWEPLDAAAEAAVARLTITLDRNGLQARDRQTGALVGIGAALPTPVLRRDQPGNFAFRKSRRDQR